VAARINIEIIYILSSGVTMIQARQRSHNIGRMIMFQRSIQKKITVINLTEN